MGEQQRYIDVVLFRYGVMSKRSRRKKQKRERNRRNAVDAPRAVKPVAQTDGDGKGRSAWEGPSGEIGTYIVVERQKTLRAYGSQPNLVAEHANHEQDTARGGYAHRQLFELVQNSADALAKAGSGNITLALHRNYLYCADNGRAIDKDGVKALMFSNMSPKRGTTEIGRFGLGFKSVLGVTDAPEFFSRSGSFRFDRDSAYEEIRQVVPGVERYPVLRLPVAIDPQPEMDCDRILKNLARWANNIVRLQLKPGAGPTLEEQINDFPTGFLLFVDHVSFLGISALGERWRTIKRGFQGEFLTLTDKLTVRKKDERLVETRWMVVNAIHELSADARADSHDENVADVPIWWAAPVDRLNEPGNFWAFFPTHTSSLLAGILNAPWKTNADRQNLLPGVYNDELIDAAAAMVAKALPRLSTKSDPAKHLDALPRRAEPWDSTHSIRLRHQLQANLRGAKIVPDQLGKLCKPTELKYAPDEITNPRTGGAARALGRWGEYEGRPVDWAHHRALTRNRLAAVRGLLASNSADGAGQLPVATVAEWLESLLSRAATVYERARASMAAIQTAALIPDRVRPISNLGKIVLTEGGELVEPDLSKVFLGGGIDSGDIALVHHSLQQDEATLSALKVLGIVPPSEETAFMAVAEKMISHRVHLQDQSANADWDEFWRLARRLGPDDAREAIISHECDKGGWKDLLRVRTLAGAWRPLYETLLPGPIVPADGSRDANVAVDTRFHEVDLELLCRLGAVDEPTEGDDLSPKRLREFREYCRNAFAKHVLPKKPHRDRFDFQPRQSMSGPLEVLEKLSDEGRAKYTWGLLDLEATYRIWTIRHKTEPKYGELRYYSPANSLLRAYGRIETDSGIRPLADGLGDPPKDLTVLRELLAHPRADRIRRFFKLPDVEDISVEPLDEDAPTPLLDVWPGLKEHLSIEQRRLNLVRCDGFRTFGRDAPKCVVRDRTIFVTRRDDEERELDSILSELAIHLNAEAIRLVLRGQTLADVQEARKEVKAYATDEERLLAAVGEHALRRRLPHSLIAILEDADGPLSGVQVAQAAIATYHTGALREYRNSLEHLDPPRQWAGRQPAIRFVRALGFSDEWAGDANVRRDPFVEVDGPFSLPPLHDYQRVVVDNARNLIRSGGTLGERRGMISMPTGSGKTRVAVQAIVEAMREGEFKGGVLWVADRDELCEQAVEAWREVWASEGTQKARLRISRMWAGQQQPLPTAEMHVIVATIQTLSARLAKPTEEHDFLSEFKLLVFDEAHRSIAPSPTYVMEKRGLTRWRRAHEPILIGLTATPYRGHDERETERLVRRYSSNRLDHGAFVSDHPEDVIAELQNMRVLAEADHQTIEGGEFSMTPKELGQSRATPWLPRSVELRIASDAERTRRIIGAYHEHVGPDWPALVFATSVEHSQTVAALLTRDGIKARAVSANTETSVRRRIVEEFRAGEIDALVNYGIFREGFDAPKTRAIIVARPVYSPNLYFQMIGRGLRGVKNGGNDRCLILNVQDNITNYRRKLAFSALDWLWAT